MRNVVIVEPVRTAVGGFGGAFKSVHAHELGEPVCGSDLIIVEEGDQVATRSAQSGIARVGDARAGRDRRRDRGGLRDRRGFRCRRP